MRDSILVVDDDSKVLDILDRSLRKKGHDVQLARDGEQALAAFKASTPDMVVLDIMLPDMDGRDVLRIMRSVPGNRVPVLFLSADSDPELKVASLNSGGEDFLVKPFSLREFNAKVRKVLKTYHQTRLLEERTEELIERTEALEGVISKKEEDYLQINKDLKRQLLSMNTLFNISQDLNRRLDLEEMINGFALTLVGELQVSSLAIFTVRRERDEYFHLRGLKGFDRSRIEGMQIKVKSEFADLIMDNPRPQRVARRDDDQWIGKLPDMRLAIFEYVTPIIVKQKLRGLVFTGPRLGSRDYTRYDLEMLQSVCNSAGIGLDNARLFRELQGTYLSTVKSLVSIIEAKDAYTRGHTERVADYSIALASKMKLSREHVRDIAFGAVLHDIGKLLVYERILNKPGSLTDEEWDVLKQHPTLGAGIIENMEFLAGTVPLVRHHHERFDGSGYPDGLRGDQIPLGARIIAVADAFDAMTTNRPYRQAMDWSVALRALRAKSNSQFDPEVVQAFVALIEDDGFRPRKKTPRLPAEAV